MKSLFVVTLVSLVLNSTAGDKTDKTAWKSIFNGKDMTNWKLVGSTGVAEIKDSAFYCHMTSNTSEHTFVCTTEKYDDFFLEMDVNTDPGYNTGILLRCVDKPVGCDTSKVSLYGYQVKIDPSPTRCWTGGIFDDFGATWHWLYDLSQDDCKVIPISYDRALRNPLMGFTTRGIYDHPWATTAQTYIRWNEIENQESDGIEKIKKVCDEKWLGVEEKNTKVIPRVYLHWSGNRKYWPADMQKDDYTSEQFQKRVLRLIKRLGECWDNDPRVAYIELGIFGKWGEHHSPSATPEMQKLVGEAFAEAFKNKKVSVRHNWSEFQEHPFGEYWDSWAHYDQMWPHGNSIKKINDKGRYLDNYIGGEMAYDWGNGGIQPGPSPTSSVAEEKHRNFVINSIRWLHCTQLRWIENYDQNNEAAVKGASGWSG